MERMELAKEQNNDAIGEAENMPGSATDRGALSIGQLAKRWRLSPARVKGLVDSGLLPGSFTVPGVGRYGEAIRIPICAVLEAEEKWAINRHDGNAARLPRRRQRGSRPVLEHLPELNLEPDVGCREGDQR